MNVNQLVLVKPTQPFKVVLQRIKTGKAPPWLDLSHQELEGKKVSLLTHALKAQQKKDTGISKLDVSHNFFKDDGCVMLCEDIRGHQNLLNLNLTMNYIGDRGAKELADLLRHNKVLMMLVLSSNEIKDRGVGYLARALKINGTLLTLDLSGNRIKDPGALQVAEAIKKNTVLTTLDMSSNDITEIGVAALLEGVRVNRSLTELSVKGFKKSFMSPNPLIKVFSYAKRGQTGDGSRHQKLKASGGEKKLARTSKQGKLLKRKTRTTRASGVTSGGNASSNFSLFRQRSLSESSARSKTEFFSDYYTNEPDEDSENAPSLLTDFAPVNEKIDMLLSDNKKLQENAVIDAVLQDCETPLNRAKLMVLGSHGSGKTSFCKALVTHSYGRELYQNNTEERGFFFNFEARTAARSNAGAPWTPTYADEYFGELCANLAIKRMHAEQMVKKERRKSTLLARKDSQESDGLVRKDVVYDSLSETLYSLKDFDSKRRNRMCTSHAQMEKAKRIASDFNRKGLSVQKLNLDSIKFSIFDFHCSSFFKDFECLQQLYHSTHGVYVVCFDMKEFIPNSEALQVSEQHPKEAKPSGQLMSSLGTSQISSRGERLRIGLGRPQKVAKKVKKRHEKRGIARRGAMDGNAAQSNHVRVRPIRSAQSFDSDASTDSFSSDSTGGFSISSMHSYYYKQNRTNRSLLNADLDEPAQYGTKQNRTLKSKLSKSSMLSSFNFMNIGRSRSRGETFASSLDSNSHTQKRKKLTKALRNKKQGANPNADVLRSSLKKLTLRNFGLKGKSAGNRSSEKIATKSDRSTQPPESSRIGKNPSVTSDYKKRPVAELNSNLEKLRHFLNVCVSYSPHSPILLVGTHLDEAIRIDSSCIGKVNSVLSKLIRNYPQVLYNRVSDFDFEGSGKAPMKGAREGTQQKKEFLYYFPLSSSNRTGMKVIRKKMEEATRKLVFFTRKERLFYVNVLDSLLRKKQHYGKDILDLSVAAVIAKNLDINSKNSVSYMFRLFHQYGLLFYLDCCDTLSQKIIFNDFDLSAFLGPLLQLKPKTSRQPMRKKLRNVFYEKIASRELIKKYGLSSHVKLLKYGLITRPIFKLLFQEFKGLVEYILKVFLETLIFVEWPSSVGEGLQDDVYMVPCLLPNTFLPFFEPLPWDKKQLEIMDESYMLYIVGFDFDHSCLPRGTLHRLITKLMQVGGFNKHNAVFKSYSRLFFKFKTLGLDNLDGSFGFILKEDNRCIYLLVSDFLFEEGDLIGSSADLEQTLEYVAVKLLSFVTDVFHKIKGELHKRQHISWRRKFCPVRSLRRDGETDTKFDFMLEKEARDIQLKPWFSAEWDKKLVKTTLANIDLESFLSDDSDTPL